MSESARKPPPNLPYPVVFGPSFPDFKMVTKQGRQVFSSRTNQNLFLETWHFSDQGTLTMARLLRLVATYDECWPLIWEDVYEDEDYGVMDWSHFLAEPAWDASEAFKRLLGYCSSEHEKRFLLEWCRSQYRRNIEGAYVAWRDALPSLNWHWNFDELTFSFVDIVFDFPALVPETWLNYVGPDKTAEDELHLAENPSRVDFALFAVGRKCVVEIDGPSHYADFDPIPRIYTVNEARYAKNLAIERSLRRQGWEIYRFANLEVSRSSGMDFVKLVVSAEVPGFVWVEEPWLRWDGTLPEVDAAAVGQALNRFLR